MARDEAKTIRVRCTTWDQVEQFYAEKIKGNVLVVKMPFKPALGEGMTVALGLPDGLVFAIDGTVMKIGDAPAGQKIPVALKLVGLTPDVKAQLVKLVTTAKGAGRAFDNADFAGETTSVLFAAAVKDAAPEAMPVVMEAAPAPPQPTVFEVIAAPPELRAIDVPPAERGVFNELERARQRLTSLPANEVLGVPRDADALQVRAAYFALTKSFHPDRYGRYRSPAVRALASEVFVHVNKAYDRMREAASLAAGARLPGPAAASRYGWFAGMEDLDAPPSQPEFTTLSSPMPVVVAAQAAPPVLPEDDDYSDMQISETPDDPELSDTSPTKRAKPLSAEELFGDLGDQPLSARQSSSSIRAGFVDAGKNALAGGRWAEARATFAEVLRQDPKNRPVRALYHVASGMELRGKGQGAAATVQFETALRHDAACEEARAALQKKGIYKQA